MQFNRTNLRLKATLAMLAGVACAGTMLPASDKDAGRGREAFEKRCTGCHTLDNNKVGPPLRRVYGRKAGKDPQFSYSDAMKNTSVSWDEPTLDRWLNDTESVISGNDMAFRLNDPVDRSNIIAYLRQLAGK